MHKYFLGDGACIKCINKMNRSKIKDINTKKIVPILVCLDKR